MFSVTSHGCLFNSNHTIAAADAGKKRGEYAQNMSIIEKFFQDIVDFFTPNDIWLAREHLGKLFAAYQKLSSDPLLTPQDRCSYESNVHKHFTKLWELASLDCKDNFIVDKNTLILITNKTKQEKIQHDLDIDFNINLLAGLEECPTLDATPIQVTEIGAPVLRVTLNHIHPVTGRETDLSKQNTLKQTRMSTLNAAINPEQWLNEGTTIAEISHSLNRTGCKSIRLAEILLALNHILNKEIDASEFIQDQARLHIKEIQRLRTLAKAETNDDNLDDIRDEFIGILKKSRHFLREVSEQLKPPSMPA